MPRDKSWYRIENKTADEASIYIYDEISYYGITAAQFMKDLGEVTAKVINLHINSPGGDVFDGITIYNGLRNHAATVKVSVDGLAASIASIIAMAGDEVRMAKNSYLMIHRASSIAWGNDSEMLRVAKLLQKIDTTLVDTYQDKTGKNADEIKALMDAETWLTAEEALSYGFADMVGDPAEIKARFDLGKFKNTPQAVAAMNIKPENERDLEAVLRDSGLSKKQALTAVAALKIEALRDSEAEEVEKMKQYRQMEGCKILLQ